MTKADIAQKVHKAAGIDEKSAASVLESVLELLKATLRSGEAINITGFGKFSVREKKARRGRNPKTGETIMVSARRAISFHVSPLFKQYVNDKAICKVSPHEQPTKEVQGSVIEGAA